MPPRGTIGEAREFAQVHGGWIAARLGRLPKAAPFTVGTLVPLRGVPHRLVHRSGERGTVWTETRDSGEKILCVAGDPDFTDRRVHDFLKREARKDLSRAAQAYAGELGVRVRRVSIRDQSSRWGSCTTAGSLSFSWRLILAPPFVLDYLAAHEVAHLVEMNHSARFWRVVGKVCCSVERAKTWLDTHGNDLHRYGIED
jgi:predicted metal-dependent hydrolase